MTLARVAGVLAGAVAYWSLVRWWGGVAEPWDAPAYWTIALPVALLLSAAAGLLFRHHGWAAGAIVMAAQLPVLLLHAAPGPLWAAGLLFIAAEAVPAMLVAALAAMVARRAGRRR